MLRSFRLKIVERLIELNEKLFFERRLLKIYNNIFDKNLNCVVDVGSNKGQTVDFFLRINPDCKIYGFEPNPRLYKYLEKKYHRYKNIKFFNLGISNCIGKKVFYENIFDLTSSFEELNLNSEYLKKKSSILGVIPENIINSSYNVSTTTLSHFINNNINEDIDVLKIDTEGHEYDCLLGLFNEKISVNVKYLQLENHNDDMYINKVSFNTIVDLLKSNKYNFDVLVPHGYGLDYDEVLFKKC